MNGKAGRIEMFDNEGRPITQHVGVDWFLEEGIVVVVDVRSNMVTYYPQRELSRWVVTGAS
jgi:hypothetical protein